MNNIDLSSVEKSLETIAAGQGSTGTTLSFLIAVATSIATFIVCELLKNILFEPRSRYKKLKEEIAGFIRLYLPYFSKPLDITNDSMHDYSTTQEYITAKDDIRRCASELMGFADTLPSIHLGVPNPRDLYDASNRLFVLASKIVNTVWERLDEQNSMYWDESIDTLVSKIKKSLEISSQSVEEKP